MDGHTSKLGQTISARNDPRNLSRAPALLAGGPEAKLIWEFFTAHIRNHHTRRAYFAAADGFARWCRIHNLELLQAEPVHIAAYIEGLSQARSRPTAKLHLAAIRMLFDWLVVKQQAASNPAASVRGPRHSARKGKTPVLTAAEMRHLLASIDTQTVGGLRDRALLTLMAYTFARVGAVIQLRVEDYYVQGRRGWVRLQEKGGKITEIPCHHLLEQFLDEYIEKTGLTVDQKLPLFPSLRHGLFTGRPLAQANVHAMVRKRAAEAGIRTRVNCHSFRATGITTYLSNGGRLEIAQQMAGHASPRTTGLYDRRNDVLSLDEIERIIY